MKPWNLLIKTIAGVAGPFLYAVETLIALRETLRETL